MPIDFSKYKKKEVSEPEPIKEKEPKKILVAKKIEAKKIVPEISKKEDVFEGYEPPITSIMTAHYLLFGKEIRKYKGKSTKNALKRAIKDKLNI